MPLGEKQLRPQDVQEDSSGQCKRPFKRYNPDGTTYEALIPVCERCWEQIPQYIDAPSGWVSPASNSKLRATTIEGKAGVEALAKVVCYECYKQDALDMFGVFADFPHEVKA